MAAAARGVKKTYRAMSSLEQLPMKAGDFEFLGSGLECRFPFGLFKAEQVSSISYHKGTFNQHAIGGEQLQGFFVSHLGKFIF